MTWIAAKPTERVCLLYGFMERSLAGYIAQLPPWLWVRLEVLQCLICSRTQNATLKVFIRKKTYNMSQDLSQKWPLRCELHYADVSLSLDILFFTTNYKKKPWKWYCGWLKGFGHSVFWRFIIVLPSHHIAKSSNWQTHSIHKLPRSPINKLYFSVIFQDFEWFLLFKLQFFGILGYQVSILEHKLCKLFCYNSWGHT